MKPKLRPVDVKPVTHQGQYGLLLRDPLGLADKAVIVPPQVIPLLALCDGTRDVPALRAVLALRNGIDLSLDIVQRILDQLDDVLLLDNERSAAAYQSAVESFRAAPFRAPASAGAAYPAQSAQLRALLDAHLDGKDAQPAPAEFRGLISPHIDYARGGPVYGRLWGQAREMVKTAELVVIFGTDHAGSNSRLTLTRQSYATPLGLLPTDQGVVDDLAQAMGPELAFADELHHRAEHSIELAAVWLQHVRGSQPCPLVPILCGSFHSFVAGEQHPTEDPAIEAAVQVLREVTAKRRTLVVAAGDLAHMGPAFDGEPVDVAGRAHLQSRDELLLQTVCQGKADQFLQFIKDESDRRNVCGVPPIYLTLRVLGATSGQTVAYDRCPADAEDTSFVSICGVILS
ncbi:MAG: AmmeMemoRadiSam system protein B [Chloroflexota bacterium]|nr:MAG: AmmeMemoRadiSam system protein B [Chloroflexota bacterium]